MKPILLWFAFISGGNSKVHLDKVFYLDNFFQTRISLQDFTKYENIILHSNKVKENKWVKILTLINLIWDKIKKMIKIYSLNEVLVLQ